MGNLKMLISTKSCYKLFNAVQKDSLSMCQIIYDDYIRPICPQNIQKFSENGKSLKNLKSKYLPNHFTNFSMLFKTTVDAYFKSRREYIMILSPNMHTKLRIFSKNGKPENVNFLPNHVTTIHVNMVLDYLLCMFKILRRYRMIVSAQRVPNKLDILHKIGNLKSKYRLNHATNFSLWFITTFYVYFKLLRGYLMMILISLGILTNKLWCLTMLFWYLTKQL